jgi:IgGFc binding protein/Bacterial Ig-like domain (group 1)
MSLRRTLRKLSVLLLFGILASGLTITCGPAHAANDSLGTDFWLTFPTNYFEIPTLTLFISGPSATTGTVEWSGNSQPFAVTPGNVTAISIPPEAQLSVSDGIEVNQAIHVTTKAEVTVYGLNRIPATTDAYLGLPTDVLGTQYIVLSYGFGFQPSEFAVVGTQDNTTVTITPSVDTLLHRAGVTYAVVLNQGDAYQLRNDGESHDDLSGTVITSNKPVAVFGADQCADIPPTAFACDHIVEQLPPTSTWGKSFLTVPLATRRNGDTFRFLASTDETHVSVNGTPVATLNRGQFWEQIIDGLAQVTADQPILVAQYSNGTTFDNVTSDPFMMLIPPFEQFLSSYTVATLPDFDNYINVVAPAGAVGAIKLDGTTIPSGNFAPIGSSGFSGAQLLVDSGSHTLVGPLPFGTFVYGFADFDSYGYPGGASYAPVALVTNLVLTPKAATNPVGTQHCVTATVTDQNGNPLAGVRVDFTVDGANSTAGSANTDSSGQAQFCYTGTNAGTDAITAAVGTVSDHASKTWGDCSKAEDPCVVVGPPADEDYLVQIPPGSPPRLSPGIRVHVSFANIFSVWVKKSAQVFPEGPCRRALAPSDRITIEQFLDDNATVLTAAQVRKQKASFKKLTASKQQALLAALSGVGDFDAKVFSLHPDTLSVAAKHGCTGIRLHYEYELAGVGIDLNPQHPLTNVIKGQGDRILPVPITATPTGSRSIQVGH